MAPSFRTFKSTSATASTVGRSNRSKDTSPERGLRQALASLGIKLLAHDSKLPGCPDFCLPSEKIAIFCDGDFWHGRCWRTRKAKLRQGSNAAYWIAKIERNRIRDREVNKALRDQGWFVVRVWESEIKRDSIKVALAIRRTISRLRKSAQN